MRILQKLCISTFFVVLAYVFGALPAKSAALKNDYRGIYVVIAPQVTQANNPDIYEAYQAALADPDIDGAAIIVKWSELYNVTNAGPGNYNWTFLDNWTADLVSLNKKIEIGVVAGMYTPAWLLAQPYSVPANYFTFNSGPVQNADCVTRLLPKPWNPEFIRQYNQMMRDLAAHLKQTGAYDALRLVKLDGINEETQELGVGGTRAADYNCPLTNSQYLTTGWAAADFAPYKIYNAWREISRNIASAFAEKQLSIDILASQGGFPSIDNTGQIITPPPGATDATTLHLMNLSFLPGPTQPVFSNRLSVQWDALSTGATDPEVQAAGAMGANIAWQVNDRLGALGAGCLGTDGQFEACQTSAQYQAILDNGINLNGQFLEVAAPDVLMYPDAFTEPHQRLVGQTPAS